jgi:PAS domain S-box-containing protein
MTTEGRDRRPRHEQQTVEVLRQEIQTLRCRIAELEASRAGSEIDLLEMANTIRDVFWIFDWQKQKVIYASPAYEEIWGRSVQDLCDCYEEWSDGLHPDDREAARASFAEVVETGGGELREYRVVRPDGTIRWVSDRAYRVSGEDGRICRVVGLAKDITEHKRAEESLRESELRLRAAVESLPFDFFILDKDERYVMVNSAARANRAIDAGLRPEDVCSDEATLALWKDNNRRALAGEVVKGEVQMAPHGKKGYYYNIISPIRDGDEIHGILGVNIDITALKRTEEALRESEEKFRNLAEQSPSMIFINQGGRVIYINRRCEECLGVKKEEFYAPTFDFMTLIAPEYRDLIRENLRRHLNGEEIPEVAYALRARDGRRIEALLATKLTRYQGEVAILGTVTDITALKQAEEALQQAKDELEQRVRERTLELEAEVARRQQVEVDLREREEQYRALVESAGDAISTVREDGVYLFANKTVGEHLQCAPEEMVGKTVWDLFPKPFADDQMAHIREVIRTGVGSSLLKQADIRGQLVWFSVTVKPLKSGGKNDTALVIARDVDDLVQARKQLEDYREQMTRADCLASLGTMSAMVAHELTQPLTVLRLSIQNALEAIRTGSAASAVIEDLQNSVEEVSTMTGIIERFRGFARASSPSQQFNVDLSAIAVHMVDVIAEAAARARVSVSLQGLDTLPAVSARAKDMEQIFFALLMNAIQAADGATDRTIVVRGQARDGEIGLSFEDTCGGIAPEHADQIFHPFFTTKGAAEGTGLGLCVVEHILDRYGAKIQAQNRPGEGVTFKVTLPLADSSSS